LEEGDQVHLSLTSATFKVSCWVRSPTVWNGGYELGRWIEQSNPPAYLLALNGSTVAISIVQPTLGFVIDSRGPRIASRLIGLVVPIALGQVESALPFSLGQRKKGGKQRARIKWASVFKFFSWLTDFTSAAWS